MEVQEDDMEVQEEAVALLLEPFIWASDVHTCTYISTPLKKILALLIILLGYRKRKST